ncbi:unnamed protein product [Lactuca saligna]|uniref:Uncharacterized protein n=1 Tax=Lactuca saligna TaxID=75948 RepID=A0AA36E131_LACSI|nr:unnamed protein product [Lactuca saligna]
MPPWLAAMVVLHGFLLDRKPTQPSICITIHKRCQHLVRTVSNDNNNDATIGGDDNNHLFNGFDTAAATTYCGMESKIRVTGIALAVGFYGRHYLSSLVKNTGGKACGVTLELGKEGGDNCHLN